MKTIAIIPAAGFGKRFGGNINKTFHPLCGRPILSHVLQTFQDIDEIDEIIPVLKDDDLEMGREIIAEDGISKVLTIVKGGRERQDSILNALDIIGDTNAILVIHDGARALITQILIKKTISELKTSINCDGIIPAVKMIDTIKEVDGDSSGFIVKTLNRDRLRSIQTPQTFFSKTLISAYRYAKDKGLTLTDDAAMVEYFGGRIKYISGDYKNIKITSKEDLLYAEFLMRQNL